MDNNLQEQLNKMLTMIAATTEDECDCEKVDQLMEEVAELAAAGVELSDHAPDIVAHFERCGCCRTEFEALKLILSSEVD